MKPRAEHLVILVAVLVAGVVLGGRDVGAVLARTIGPAKAAPPGATGTGPGLGWPRRWRAKPG